MSNGSITLFNYTHNDQSTIWMPPRYIMWQIEQTDISNNSLVPKFNERYFQDLQNSICVFEMSRDNIKFYQEKIYPTPIYYQPLPFAQLTDCNSKQEYLYDIVFFGTPNPRRMVILESLRKKLPSEIKTNWLYKIYNSERDEILQKTKIVLNLHYYENPVLETDRFNIAINNNCYILSEDVDSDIENKELYQEFVTFFDPINVSDSDKLGEGIDKLTSIIQYHLKKAEIIKNQELLQIRSFFEENKVMLCNNHVSSHSSNNYWEVTEKLPISMISKKTGVVITTNGYWGVIVRQCIECYIRELGNDIFIVLFINESEDDITLDLSNNFPQIKK